MIYLASHIYWIWVALVIVLTLIECFTMGLTTIWFAISAFVMIFLSFTKIPFVTQVLIWLLLSTVILFFTRPIALKKMKIGKEKTNVEALVGKRALVTKKITKFDKGEIKVNGVFWSAKTEDDSELQENTECEILRTEGVTAIVKSC